MTRDIEEVFPLGMRVDVRWPMSTTRLATGAVIGYEDGPYDFGTEGPGPVEPVTYLLVESDDGTTRRVFPGDAEPSWPA